MNRKKSTTLGTLVGVILATIVLGGCGLWGIVDPSFSTATLTQDVASDTYALSYASAAGAVTVTAAANTGGNGRGVFWTTGQTASADGESCARWRTENGGQTVAPNIQEGAALRIRTNKDGSVDALTVTRNVYYQAVWIFNVHTWSAGETYTLIGQYDLGAVFAPAGITPLPWNLCAEVVGRRLSFIVWPDSETKPVYGDASHGAQQTVPANYVYSGHIGWYIGHLTAGQTAVFDHMSASDQTH